MTTITPVRDVPQRAPAALGHNSGDANNSGNWFALSRDVREHPLVGAGQPVAPANKDRAAWSKMEAWIDLLALAQFRPSRINNKGQMIILHAGQLMGALPYLAERWNWTVGTVRWYLNALERDEMISRSAPKSENYDRPYSRQPTNKCNVITISNYGKYQIMLDAIDAHVSQAKRQANSRRATGELQANDKNLTLKQSNNKNQTVRDEVERLSISIAQADTSAALGAVWKAVKRLEKILATSDFNRLQSEAIARDSALEAQFLEVAS